MTRCPVCGFDPDHEDPIPRFESIVDTVIATLGLTGKLSMTDLDQLESHLRGALRANARPKLKGMETGRGW